MPLHYIGERTVHHVGNFKDSVVLRIAEDRTSRIIWIWTIVEAVD
jgi:hypothetical protein